MCCSQNLPSPLILLSPLDWSMAHPNKCWVYHDARSYSEFCRKRRQLLSVLPWPVYHTPELQTGENMWGHIVNIWRVQFQNAKSISIFRNLLIIILLCRYCISGSTAVLDLLLYYLFSSHQAVELEYDVQLKSTFSYSQKWIKLDYITRYWHCISQYLACLHVCLHLFQY